MFLIVAPVIGAAIAALASGGSWRGLARPIAWWPLALAAIAAELALTSSPVAHHPLVLAGGHWAWAGTLVCVLLVLARNAAAVEGCARTAWAAAAAGVALNLTVIFANGGYMPLSAEALNGTGMAREVAARTAYRRDTAIDDATRLPWLADVIAEPVWIPRASVLSLGDVLLMCSLAGLTFARSRREEDTSAQQTQENQRQGLAQGLREQDLDERARQWHVGAAWSDELARAGS